MEVLGLYSALAAVDNSGVVEDGRSGQLEGLAETLRCSIQLLPCLILSSFPLCTLLLMLVEMELLVLVRSRNEVRDINVGGPARARV